MDTLNLFHANSYAAKAEEDIVNAQAVIPGHLGTPRGGAFWCEQAIEKYFKHILVQNGRHEELTTRHKLLPLASEAGYKCSEDIRIVLRELGQMYYERYPVAQGEELPEDPTWEEVEMIYRITLDIREWAISVIKRRNNIIRGKIGQMRLD